MTASTFSGLVGLNSGADGVCDYPIGLAARMLVDKCGPWAVLPHAIHEAAQRCTRLRCEVISGVPQVVEVQAGLSDGGNHACLRADRPHHPAAHRGRRASAQSTDPE